MPSFPGIFRARAGKSLLFALFQSSARATAIRRRSGPTGEPGVLPLQLQVAVHEVVLLEAAQALFDLPRAHRPDAAHRLELPLTRTNDRVEPLEVGDHPPDDRLRHARDVREDAV